MFVVDIVGHTPQYGVMNSDDELIISMLSKAREHAKSRRISLSYLGRKIINDGDFFDRLASGGDCHTRTYQKVMRWLSQHSPAPSIPKQPEFSHEIAPAENL